MTHLFQKNHRNGEKQDKTTKIYEGDNGKTEMWYVIDADEGASLIYGFQHEVTEEILRKAIETGTLDKHLQKVPVHKGDTYFVPAGTVHGIGKGILVAEIQESSNVTYRVYDYDRVDKNGKKRELHFDKAVQVMNMKVAPDVSQKPRIVKYYSGCSRELLCRCKYFETERIQVTKGFAFSVIACGEEVKTNLVDYYHLSKDKVAVIHNAVKPYMESIKPDAYLKKLKEDGYIIVGNIGRLSEQKGMEYFIDSYKKVHESIDKLKYVVVGQGEDEQSLKRKVEEEYNQDNIVFLGYRSDIQNIIAQMDYIVLSSLWEGLPLTPIEAFSVHRPVIGTAVDGTKEIIENGNNGFLIAPRSAQEIAEKVIELAQNEKERLEMGEHAYITYKEKFDFSVFQANVLDFYKQRI